MKNLKYYLILVVGLILIVPTKGQTTEIPPLAFKSFKIGNLQSSKIANQGKFYLGISYRTSSLNDSTTSIFDWNNSSTQLSLLYGIWDRIQLGISAETYRQTYGASAKIGFLQQNDAFPLDITGFTAIQMDAELSPERYPLMKFFDRLSYTSQIIVAHHFSNGLSIEAVPTFIRQNLVLEPFQQHNQIVIGFGGSLKVSKRLSLNVDYVHNLSRAATSIYQDPFTLTLDMKFDQYDIQLLFSNADAINEASVISNAKGSWADLDIFFGLNVLRQF